jgi:hypothetical protein
MNKLIESTIELLIQAICFGLVIFIIFWSAEFIMKQNTIWETGKCFIAAENHYQEALEKPCAGECEVWSRNYDLIIERSEAEKACKKIFNSKK